MLKKVIFLAMIIIAVCIISSNYVYAVETEPDFDKGGEIVIDTVTQVVLVCVETGTRVVVDKAVPGAGYPTARVVRYVTKKEMDELVDKYELDKKSGKVVRIVYEGESYVMEHIADAYVKYGIDDFEIKYGRGLKKEKMIKDINQIADKAIEKTADLYVKSGMDDFVTNRMGKDIINR